MSENGTHITPQLVRSAIESRCNLVQLPLDMSFAQLGLNDTQLIFIRMEINKWFKKDVPVRILDTIYTLTDRLTGKGI